MLSEEWRVEAAAELVGLTLEDERSGAVVSGGSHFWRGWHCGVAQVERGRPQQEEEKRSNTSLKGSVVEVVANAVDAGQSAPDPQDWNDVAEVKRLFGQLKNQNTNLLNRNRLQRDLLAKSTKAIRGLVCALKAVAQDALIGHSMGYGAMRYGWTAPRQGLPAEDKRIFAAVFTELERLEGEWQAVASDSREPSDEVEVNAQKRPNVYGFRQCLESARTCIPRLSLGKARLVNQMLERHRREVTAFYLGARNVDRLLKNKEIDQVGVYGMIIANIKDFPDRDKKRWGEIMLRCQDGRFQKDKFFCFYGLNYIQRLQNSSSSNWFINNFNKGGPTNLEELKEAIIYGDNLFVNRITYFNQHVYGSTAFWLKKRNKIYVWINHHVQMGHGAPMFFITLSCAEHCWSDTIALIKERMELAGDDTSGCYLGSPQLGTFLNECTLVVQEHFQLRVTEWLETVGKLVLGIYIAMFDLSLPLSKVKFMPIYWPFQKTTLFTKYAIKICKNQMEKNSELNKWRMFLQGNLVSLQQSHKITPTPTLLMT